VADHCVPDARGSYASATNDAGGAKDAAARDATASDASPAPDGDATASDASPAPDGDAVACTGPIGTKSLEDVSDWWTLGDGTGTQSPDPFVLTGGRACLSGSGFTSWGTQIGLERSGPAGVTCKYDLSSYTGITFTVSGTIPNGYFWLAVPVTPGHLYQHGGNCCEDSFGTQVAISAQPQSVTVAFSQLIAERGTALLWDPVHILGLVWEIRPLIQGVGLSFTDVCVSDVQLY
jgi:hypothetical protein